MADATTVYFIAPDGDTLAELSIKDEEEGWFTGKVVWQSFPPKVQSALAWYDEVVQDQMLSYLDEAVAAVQRLKLRAIFPDGSMHKAYSLHISPADEVAFRISPVLPPPELPQAATRAE
jgi:hypothetical protein